MIEFNRTDSRLIDLLLTRRSAKARELIEPGPDKQELDEILRSAVRVPDHGKIGPWRLFVFEGEAREAFGKAIGACYDAEEPKASRVTRKGLEKFPLQAPVMIAVASVPDTARPIPEWEQILSSGACCMNLLNAAHSLGYIGQWITGWAAYSDGVRQHLGLPANGRIAGFVFLGSHPGELTERPRAPFDEVVSFPKG